MPLNVRRRSLFIYISTVLQGDISVLQPTAEGRQTVTFAGLPKVFFTLTPTMGSEVELASKRNIACSNRPIAMIDIKQARYRLS